VCLGYRCCVHMGFVVFDISGARNDLLVCEYDGFQLYL
jgi:hypothetical protein